MLLGVEYTAVMRFIYYICRFSACKSKFLKTHSGNDLPHTMCGLWVQKFI